jgi:hypothetical protein
VFRCPAKPRPSQHSRIRRRRRLAERIATETAAVGTVWRRKWVRPTGARAGAAADARIFQAARRQTLKDSRESAGALVPLLIGRRCGAG